MAAPPPPGKVPTSWSQLWSDRSYIYSSTVSGSLPVFGGTVLVATRWGNWQVLVGSKCLNCEAYGLSAIVLTLHQSSLFWEFDQLITRHYSWQLHLIRVSHDPIRFWKKLTINDRPSQHFYSTTQGIFSGLGTKYVLIFCSELGFEVGAC